MSKLTNQEFINFLKSFDDGENDNQKYLDTITEISRKHSGKRESLIENDKKMYSLDDIAKGSKTLNSNLPKTADALYFKEEDDKLSLYFIEFKFHNLDDPDAKDLLYTLVDELYAFPKKFKCVSKYKRDLNKIKKYYGDNVKHSLILKPIESIRVVIPKLYKEYDSDINEKEIERFLNNIEKKLIVFVSTYTEEGKANLQKERLESMSTGLEQHFDRLKDGNIINNYQILPSSNFDEFLENESLN